MEKDFRSVKKTIYPTRSIRTRSQCHSRRSYFHQLPPELLYMVLDKLSLLELSVFSLVSKEMNRSIMDYISTKAWKSKIIIQNHSAWFGKDFANRAKRQFRDLGLLFKRCSMLLPAKEKFRFIFSQLSKTLTAQWDEPECQRVINFLLEQTNLLQKMEAVVTAKAEVRGDQELQLRCFCRKVLLDPWISQPQCQFWLMQLLKPWPMVSQARLLFIFYGPLTPEGTLGWEDVVDRGLTVQALCDLARAFLLLFCKRDYKVWTTNSMLAILEELIVIPQPWHMENVARLLVLCGDSLCYTVLASKALNGRLTEVSRIIVYIILVHERDRFNMAAVVKLVLQISRIFSTPTERFFFIQKMEDMFSEITREFYEMSVRGNQQDNREAFQKLCVLLDSSARFHTTLFLQFTT
uniref:F-box protein 47 n=1 Tax=Cynoglossus semilaevis TaxID=244447 RepID=A0A3P8VZB5_CYNSE